MPKVIDDPALEGIRGMMGDLVFRRMPNGETWISKNYDFSRAQKSHQGRFPTAVTYAKCAAKLYPIYAQLAKGTVKSPYNWALSYWFNPPVIYQVEGTKERIRVRATDNVLVTKVRVPILDAAGKVLGTGSATKIEGDWWEYATNLKGKIVAEAWDMAGNAAKHKR